MRVVIRGYRERSGSRLSILPSLPLPSKYISSISTRATANAFHQKFLKLYDIPNPSVLTWGVCRISIHPCLDRSIRFRWSGDQIHFMILMTGTLNSFILPNIRMHTSIPSFKLTSIQCRGKYTKLNKTPLKNRNPPIKIAIKSDFYFLSTFPEIYTSQNHPISARIFSNQSQNTLHRQIPISSKTHVHLAPTTDKHPICAIELPSPHTT